MNLFQKKELFSIVIPVYNSSSSLIELEERIRTTFENILENKFDYEIIFVDDYSSNENTWKTLITLAKSKNTIKAVRLTKNFGQQSSTLCGMKQAKGDYIITMDDDLQHCPEDIPKLIDNKNHDIVLGYLKKKKHNAVRNLFSRIKDWFYYKLINKPKHVKMSSFRLLNRLIVDGILSFKTPYPFIPALMFAISQDIANVEVNHCERKTGKSGYSFYKMLKLFSNLLINNSSYLLRITGFAGINISILSFGLVIFFILKKLIFNIPVAGWTSVIVSVLFIGGLILFSTGVIGEYLIRIIHSQEQPESYFIREIAGKKDYT